MAKESIVVDVGVFSVGELSTSLGVTGTEVWILSLGNKRGEGRYVDFEGLVVVGVVLRVVDVLVSVTGGLMVQAEET